MASGAVILSIITTRGEVAVQVPKSMLEEMLKGK
jgi:hypothetical protein